MTYVVPAVVLFATDSSTITSRGQTVLRAMKPRLVGATSIAIAGCTDDVGGVDSPSNIKLSWARALAARNALVALGLHQGIFHLSALADTHPVPEIRGLDQATVNALNRRIIITVTREAQG
jgi:flagellar motor protein MotB